jgi:drug/metabolite transporter (DMT)-like permease
VLRRDRSLVRQRYQRVVETLPVLAEWADRRAGNLSGGQRRLVEFALPEDGAHRSAARRAVARPGPGQPAAGLRPRAAAEPGRHAATEDLAGLRAVPPVTLAAFLGAGLIHFSIDWTFLNASQKRIGAARTSPLLAATPLFGTILAVVTLGEVPGAVTVLAMALIVAGVYVTVGTGASPSAGSSGATPASWRGSLLGLGTAACWAVSPLLIREGLREVPAPVLGVTISMLAATIPMGAVVALRRRRAIGEPPRLDALALKLTAGVLVGVSTWSRWEALALTPVAVVLALGLLPVPTVILLAPPLAGRHEEPISARILLGAALVVAGSLVLVVRG